MKPGMARDRIRIGAASPDRLTQAVVSALNPDVDLAELGEDRTQTGYPA
jgi:hypothetical protein